MANFGRSVGASLAVTVLCLMSSVTACGYGKWFDRVFIVMFENTSLNETIVDPNFKKWAEKGKLLTNYHGVTHPSEPNYLATTGGSYFGIQDDANHNVSAPNLADLLEANYISWKSYNEDYTGLCNTSAFIGSQICPNSNNTKPTNLYARKHNPFISYTSVYTNPKRCAKIVPATELKEDIEKNKVPQFSYYVPNQCNDAHDTNVSYAGKWLDQFITETFTCNAILGRTLVVLTFDEDDFTPINNVYTALIPFGVMNIKNGSTDNTYFNHYSLLRTIEDNWGLGTLHANDSTAQPFNFPRKRSLHNNSGFDFGI